MYPSNVSRQAKVAYLIIPYPKLQLPSPCPNSLTSRPPRPNNNPTMAPRFRRRRQTSQTSSRATRKSQGLGGQRNRFIRHSVPSRTSSQRGPSEHIYNSTPTRTDVPPDSAQSQVPPHHQALDNDESSEALEQIVMAIDRQQRGAIGCAYYAAREEKLYCLQDMNNGSLEVIETCESLYNLRLGAPAQLTRSE